MRRSLLLLPFALVGCMTTAAHEKKIAELDALRERHEQEASAREHAAAAAAAKAIADLEAALSSARADAVQLRGSLDGATTERDTLRKQLDADTALIGELKKRLEKLGQNVDRLVSEKGQLAAGLEDSRARLEELRKQREAAEQRLATFKNLVAKFQSMIDAGQLKVVVRNGRMLISLPDNVLFDSGSTELKATGKAALGKVADVLATISDRNFLVAGHTDDVPIHTARFPSNWDLSTARAIEVVNFLVGKTMKPQALAAAGYGEFDPVAINDSPEHRALNRRIEIVLQPNLAELPSLEGFTAK